MQQPPLPTSSHESRYGGHITDPWDRRVTRLKRRETKRGRCNGDLKERGETIGVYEPNFHRKTTGKP